MASAEVTQAQRRMFDEGRRLQGFLSQEHLDAFYRCFDHQKSCAVCQGPAEAYWSEADAAWQPCGPSCPEEQRLHAASFREHFETAAVAS